MNFVDMVVDKKLYKKFSTEDGSPFEYTPSDYVTWRATTDTSETIVYSDEIVVGKFLPITSGDIYVTGLHYEPAGSYPTHRVSLYIYENDVLIGEIEDSFWLNSGSHSLAKEYEGERITITGVKAFNEYKVTAKSRLLASSGNFTNVKTYTGGVKYKVHGYLVENGSRYIIAKN